MSEPNMGFVVLGPVLGPANKISPVSKYAVHPALKGASQSQIPFFDIKKSEDTYERMMHQLQS